MALQRLFVDFNAYFASVEQCLRPELRGRPVAIAAVAADSGCCIAASYEAKPYGVKTGTRVAEARALCPGIAIVQARHREYVEMHHQLVAAVERCLPVQAVLSIDEMVCELPGRYTRRSKALETAYLIKRTIAESVSPVMRCSIGIAPNTFLAKTASDMLKPDGLTVLDSDDLPHALYRLKLGDLCGIGKRMEARLHARGITTVRQLCALNRRQMRALWGSVEGERFYEQIRGTEMFHAEPDTPQRTLGHSHILEPQLRTLDGAHGVLHKLLQKACRRLRENRLYTGELYLSVRFGRDIRFRQSMQVFETRDYAELAAVLNQLWARRPPNAREPYKVGLTLLQLVEEHNHTPSLFDDPPSRRNAQLQAAMDQVNKHYGQRTLYYASSHDARQSDAAPMRISFNHIPDTQIEED